MSFIGTKKDRGAPKGSPSLVHDLRPHFCRRSLSEVQASGCDGVKHDLTVPNVRRFLAEAEPLAREPPKSKRLREFRNRFRDQ